MILNSLISYIYIKPTADYKLKLEAMFTEDDLKKKKFYFYVRAIF